MRGDLETEQTATYWPQILLYYSSTSSSFCWVAQPGSWGPKPNVWCWLSLRHLVPNCDWNSNCDCNSKWTLPASNSNWLKPSVAPGYIIVWPSPASCGRRICTELNPSTGQGDIPISSTGCTCFLIDGSVEGQYVTIVVSKFEHQSRYYVHFLLILLEKVWTLLSPTSRYGFYSTTTVLQRYLWHWKIDKGWYTIQTKIKTKPNYILEAMFFNKR